MSTPAVARHRVRVALRSAREERQLTQSQVAEAMEWSLSKVMRIEKGEVNISPADLRMLLSFLEITDPDRVKRLSDDARTARKARLQTDSTYRGRLTPALIELMEFEREATVIRHYASALVPGIVQTPGYARAVFQVLADNLDEATVNARIDARLSRRAQVLNRPSPPDFKLLLDESVLLRVIGGPGVMAEQLGALVDRMDESPVSVRISTFQDTRSIVIYTAFTLMEVGDENNPVLYRENLYDDRIVETPQVVESHRSKFNEAWSAALGEQESAERVRRAARSFAEQESN